MAAVLLNPKLLILAKIGLAANFLFQQFL